MAPPPPLLFQNGAERAILISCFVQPKGLGSCLQNPKFELRQRFHLRQIDWKPP